MKLHAALFIVANLLATSQADSVFDRFVDAIIEAWAPKIFLDGHNEIKLPDFHYDFSYNLYIVTLYGSVRCEGGKVRSLATMHRVGEAYGDLYNGKFVGSAPIGLYALVVNFDKCTVGVKDIFSYSSPVEGNVGNNALLLNVSVEATETDCIATIGRLELTQLSDIKFSVGSGIFAGLRNEVMNAIAYAMNGYIKKNLNDELHKYDNTQFHINDIPFINHIRHLQEQRKRQ